MAEKKEHTALDKVTHVADIIALLGEYDQEDQIWMIRTVMELTETEGEIWSDMLRESGFAG